MMYLNGNHSSAYNQPVHFHYPVGRLLGSRVASDSTISGSVGDRPSRVRVSLYDAERPGLAVTPDTPEPPAYPSFTNNRHPITTTPSSITASPPNGPNHHQHHPHQHSNHLPTTDHHLTLDLAKIMERKDSVDSGIENPFRPGGELSREAETIVNLIKEGKPITPTTPTKDGSNPPMIANGISKVNGQASPVKNGGLHPTSPDSAVTKKANGMNGTPKTGASPAVVAAPGNTAAVVEVQRKIVAPSEPPPKADIVTLKRKSKCHCCIIQ